MAVPPSVRVVRPVGRLSDQADIDLAVAEIARDSYDWMVAYYRSAGFLPKLRFFGQRFGKRAKITGRTIESILRSDPRFVLDIDPETAGATVWPSDPASVDPALVDIAPIAPPSILTEPFD